MFKKQLNEGQAGDNVGLLIRGLKRDDVERGQVSWPACRGCLHAVAALPVACNRVSCILLAAECRTRHAATTSPTPRHNACSALSPGGVQAGQHQAAQEVPGRDLRAVQGEAQLPCCAQNAFPLCTACHSYMLVVHGVACAFALVAWPSIHPPYPRTHRSMRAGAAPPCPRPSCLLAPLERCAPCSQSILSLQEEGGRHTPFFTNYKPQFFFRTADVTGARRCCRSRHWRCC